MTAAVTPRQTSELEPLSWGTLLRTHSREASLRRHYENIVKRLLLGERSSGKTVLAITSARDGEGKTTTAVNVAVTLARGGRKTLLIDADWTSRRLGKLFGLGAVTGLADILTGKADLEECTVAAEGQPGLRVLPWGSNGVSVWGSGLVEGLAETIRKAEGSGDIVLIDMPSVGQYTDPVVLGGIVHGFLLVVGCDFVSRRDVQAACRDITSNRGEIVGVVLNRVPHYVPKYFLGHR